MYKIFCTLAFVLPCAAAASAQMDMSMPMATPGTLAGAIQRHSSSGTTVEPSSTPAPMLMDRAGAWTFMLHGSAFLADIQQHADNERGGDKFFSTNWLMPMAQRHFERGVLTLRAMFSLEPATVTGRFYPELFQQGETAYGKAIVDGQHPHDFIMELSALYDIKIGEDALFSLYVAPVGDPALGPTAYAHRESAAEDPIAPLGHHQQDSTHIAFSVLTAGVTFRSVRLEASGFHGAEPTEQRWNPEPSPNGVAPDSYSGRLIWAPRPGIAAQYSAGHITSPESLEPNQDQTRQTASVMFNRPLGVRRDTASMPGMTMKSAPTGNWSTTLLWGRTKSLPGNLVENSHLLESLVTLHRNSMWTRIESAGRTSELLQPAPAIERGLGSVQAFSLGFDRDYHVASHLRAAPGAQFTVYHAPDALANVYGRTPVGGVVFVRFRIAD